MGDDQGSVRVTFNYVPDDPDPDDHTGCSAEEFDRLMDELQQLGATDVKVEKVV
jgi:hypothetical protein